MTGKKKGGCGQNVHPAPASHSTQQRGLFRQECRFPYGVAEGDKHAPHARKMADWEYPRARYSRFKGKSLVLEFLPQGPDIPLRIDLP